MKKTILAALAAFAWMIQVASATVSGTVYCDANGNGVQDPGEPGIPGVLVYIACANHYETTDTNGNYFYDGPPAYNAPCNITVFPNSAPGTCTPEGPTTITTTNWPDVVNANFSFTGCCAPPCNGQIGDFVWNDLNGNGCQDPGEPGIAGVKVDLYAGCGVTGTPIRSTTTDVSGHYLFSGLCAGTYTVSFNAPTGYTRTVANSGCIKNNNPPYSNQTDSKCTCAPGTPCGVCVTLDANNPINLNVDCGYIPPACTIIGVTISGTSWNKFNIPNGTSPVVWVHAHIGKPSGIPTTSVTTLTFTGVTITLNNTVYQMPDGVMTFDPSAPATIATAFVNGKWQTLINPNNTSDEMFFTGAAIPVTPAIAAGAQATLSYTALSSVAGLSYPWQWSAAVFTYWPADWNQAMIQPYHQSDHAGTPENTTVQKALIQGPRGGGGSNFTGSWSATGKAACP